MPRPISPTLKAIKLRRVVGEDLSAHGRVRRPIEQQLEQVGILGRPGLARRGMRPVARPQHAFRCLLHQGLRQRSEEHTSELQSRLHLVCRLLLEKKKRTHVLYRTFRNPYYNSPNNFTAISIVVYHPVILSNPQLSTID